MSRNSKNKPETNLRLMNENTTDGRIVITAGCGNRKKSLEKEEASKPLYLKRV